MNVSSLDLNLLRTFVVLMEERSVSRAAERLNLSQSATSNALDRLRGALGDKVLVREGRRMQPTRSASRLFPEIAAALARIEAALVATRELDAGGMTTHFTVAIDEYAMALFGGTLVERLRHDAPRATLSFVAPDPARYPDQLRRGEMDVLVAPVWKSHPDLVRRSLLAEGFTGLMSATHPLAGKRMTLAGYTRHEHLLVSARGRVGGNVDVALAKAGRERRVALTTPWYESAARLIEGSSLLLNVGERLARTMIERHDVVEFRLPLAVPGFTICMLWHPRSSADVYHRWLRTRIEESSARA